MQAKSSTPNLKNSRRPSKLGDELAKHKIDQAKQLTLEQRLLLALELSNAAAALSNARVPTSLNDRSCPP